MDNKKIWIFSLLLFLLAGAACSGKRSGQTPHRKSDTTAVARPVAAPVYVLDTAGTVIDYETDRYTLPVETDGTYQIDVASANIGLFYILHDASGHDATNELSEPWTGKLKKGTYTLIVGLTRNAARKNRGKEVKYTVQVKRESI